MAARDDRAAFLALGQLGLAAFERDPDHARMQGPLFQVDFVPGTPSYAMEGVTDIFPRGVSREPDGE